jgi:ABC-type multidrug transport system ATPase subunit
MSLLLEVRGATKRFGNVDALNGVDLTIPMDAGVFGLVGPNGSGKTTLFSCLCGFLGTNEGSIRLAGAPVTRTHPPAPGTVSVLPQDALFPHGVSSLTLLTYYARLHGADRHTATRQATELLERVGLGDAMRRAPHTLSHGMRKRVGIAQAFLGEPRLIILDEPTAGLDPQVAREIRGLIRTIRGQRVVLVSSHNLFEVEDLCAEVAILHKGRVTRQAHVHEIVGEAREVAFRMAGPPPDAILKALEALDFVDGAEWDAGAGRLRVAIADRTKAAAAAGEIAAFFAAREVPFMEMQVGKSLEDRFLEETRQR